MQLEAFIDSLRHRVEHLTVGYHESLGGERGEGEEGEEGARGGAQVMWSGVIGSV